MTDLNAIIQQVHQDLAEADINSADTEAASIAAHVLQVDRGRLGVLQVLGQSIDQSTTDKIWALARARTRRIPLQHLTGVAGFYGLEIQSEPGVFIQRPETEILVETTLEHFAETTGPLTILDLCTGTGAIAAALAEHLGRQNTPVALWAVDLSRAAVELARTNTAPYNVTVLCADATDRASVVAADARLEALLGTFDAVVSNPPYIPTDTPVSQPEAEHDPHMALYGGSPDGTAIPLAIANQALEWLAPGGLFIMEHDETHAHSLASALQADAGWQRVATLQDLRHTDRFVSAIRSELVQSTSKTTPTLAQ